MDHLASIAGYHGSTGIVHALGSAAPPPRWRAITESTDAAERCAAALGLWPPEFLARVPRFAAAFTGRLFDVRLCTVRLFDLAFQTTDGITTAALLYAARDDEGRPVHWVGLDPLPQRRFAPAFPATLPPEVRTFLHDVHGGFTTVDGDSHGIRRPSIMATFAQELGAAEGIPGYDEEVPIPSTRLMVLSGDSGEIYCCTSPDRPPNTMITVDGHDMADGEFHTVLDELMIGPFEGL